MVSTPNRPWEIYTLSDPRTLRARYVGVTFVGGAARCRSHCDNALKGRTHRDYWIRSLLRLGYRPIYLVLEYGQGVGWQDRERFWIAIHRKFCDLTNLTDGGEGTPGHRCSPETRAKIGAASKGRPYSSETRAKMGAANKGRKRSPETRAKLSAAAKERQYSPETRAKIGAAKKGHKCSPETLVKMSRASKRRKHSPEVRAKLSATQKGHKCSLEARAKISAAQKGHKCSLEVRAKIAAAKRGKPWSAARRRAQEAISQKGDANGKGDKV